MTEQLDDLKAMVDANKGDKPNSKEGRMVAEMQDLIAKIRPIFAEALPDVGDAYQTTTKNTAEDGGVKYSQRNKNNRASATSPLTRGPKNKGSVGSAHVMMSSTAVAEILGISNLTDYSDSVNYAVSVLGELVIKLWLPRNRSLKSRARWLPILCCYKVHIREKTVNLNGISFLRMKKAESIAPAFVRQIGICFSVKLKFYSLYYSNLSISDY